jgi:hypothetical protein
MDFASLVSVLEKKSLPFVRADRFQLADPWEGSVSKVTKKWWTNDLRKEHARSIGISSWHMNAVESAAMWVQYGRSRPEDAKGVAVVSSFSRLTRAIDDPFVGVGTVSYLDYDTDTVPFHNAFVPFLCKRKSFEHERELRALTISGGGMLAKGFAGPIKPLFVESTDVIDSYPIQEEGAKYIPVELSELIESIRVAPHAKDWFFEVVMAVVKKYGLEVPVLKSQISEPGLF